MQNGPREDHEHPLEERFAIGGSGSPETLPWQSEEEPEPVSLRQLHRWAQAALRSRWPLLREVVAETFRAAVEPESIDRLPLPAGRESVFELLCVVRLLDALNGQSGQIRLLGDGVVLPRRFDALVTFDKPRAGFHEGEVLAATRI